MLKVQGVLENLTLSHSAIDAFLTKGQFLGQLVHPLRGKEKS